MEVPVLAHKSQNVVQSQHNFVLTFCNKKVILDGILLILVLFCCNKGKHRKLSPLPPLPSSPSSIPPKENMAI